MARKMGPSKNVLATSLACGAVTLVIFGIDLAVPLGVAGGVPYVLVVLMSSWFPDRRVVFLSAVACTLLTYAGFTFSSPGGEFWQVMANRLLAVFAIWVTAALLYQRKGVERSLELANRKLEERIAARTKELQEANARLTCEIGARTKAEESMRRRKDLAQHYLDVAEVMTVVINEQEDVELINKKGCALLERSESEVIGKNWFDVAFPQSQRVQARKIFRDIVAGNQQDFECCEGTIRSKSGREYVIAWHMVLLHDENARAVKVLGSGVDLTRQKETERALRLAREELEKKVEERTSDLQMANEQLRKFLEWQKTTKAELREKEIRYRTLFAQSPDAIVLIDPETTLPVEFNDVAPRLLGYTREEFSTLKIQDYEAAKTAEKIQASVQQVLDEGEDCFVTKLRTKEGEIRDFLINVRVVELQGKRIFHCIFRDITEIKQAEATLRASEARLNEAQRIAHIGSWEFDVVNNQFICSEETHRIFELNPEELDVTYEAILDRIHQDDRGHVERVYSESVRKKTSFDLVHRLVMPDGRVKWVHCCGQTFYDEQGNPLHSIGTVQDITERKQAERILKTQAQIIDQIHDSVVSTDLDGYVASWNKGAERLFEFAAHEALGRHISFVYPEEEHDFLEHQVLAPLKRKGEHEVEVRMRKKTGKDFYAHLSLSLLKDEDGSVKGMIGYSLDLTEKRRIEESLRKFEKIFNCSNDLLAFVDRTMTFRAVNKRYEEVFGIDQKDIVGMHMSELIGEAKYIEVCNSALARGLAGESLTFEHWVNLPGGRRWYMETHIDPFYENLGEISGVVVLCRNVTERHEMETLKRQYLNKVLRAQEEERARLARELHDETGQALTYLLVGLRTLLNLRSFGQMKERVEDLRAFTFRTLEEIQRLAVGLHPRILDDLGLKDTIEVYCREYTGQYGVVVDFDATGMGMRRLPREIETSLYRILQEAFTNVAKHARAQTIKVLLRCDGESVKMIIKDDGRGFAVDHAGRAGIRAGGLGLHGMRERTSMLGGSLSVESSPGHGTSLSVEIPMKERVPA